MVTEFDRYNCVISIDIGATFSGSCFSYIQNKKSIVHVVKWPEQTDDNTFEKTPTACLYSKNNDRQLLKWGKSAIDYVTLHPDDEEVILIKHFKLKLYDIFGKQRNGVKLTVEEEHYRSAAIDYLREIYLYTRKQILETVPHCTTHDEFRFVLTVPATWVADDSFGMRLIAIEVGLIKETDPKERLVIINEAFAASLFCEREFCMKKDENTRKLAKGDTYLVCDAGGSTVDLATYECTGLDGSTRAIRVGPKNEHCQLALESGGLCGSIHLDQNMELYLRNEIFLHAVSEVTIKLLIDQFIKKIKHHFGDETGNNNYIQSDIPVKSSSATTLITTEDTIMNNVQENDYNYGAEYPDSEDYNMIEEEDYPFYSDEEEGYMEQDNFVPEVLIENDSTKKLLPSDFVYFTLPDDKKYISSIMDSLEYHGKLIQRDGVKQLRIKNTDIAKHVFDPVVEQVINLISRQIQKSFTKIETLFLLGGFGQSPYLYKKLHYAFITSNFITSTNSIKYLIVPENGYRASMRGGIHHGVDCNSMIPETHIKTKEGFYCKEPFYRENYSLMVAIEINLFDLSAVYSFVDLRAKDGFARRNNLPKVFNSTNSKSMSGLFNNYDFDSNSFAENSSPCIFDILRDRVSLANKLLPVAQDMHTLEDCDNRIYYKCLIKSYIQQLFECIQNVYDFSYEPSTWDQNNVRYSISIAPDTKSKRHGDSKSSMEILNNLLFKELIEFKERYSKDMKVIADQYFHDLFLDKACLSTETDLAALEYCVFDAAKEIGIAQGTFKENDNILWTKPTSKSDLTHRTAYKHFTLFSEETTCIKTSSKKKNFKRKLNDSSLNQLMNDKEEAVCRVLRLDLNFNWNNSSVIEVNRNNQPDNIWEYGRLNAEEVDKEIERGTYTFYMMIRKLVDVVDFMCPQFYKYIQKNITTGKNHHNFGDIFIVFGTNRIIDMEPNVNVNVEGLHHAIRCFRHHIITSEEILDVLVKPWIKYRLTPMLVNACNYNESKDLHLVITGETIKVGFDYGVREGNQFFNVLEDNLRNHFGNEVPINYVSSPRYVRHVHCLVNGFNSEESFSVRRVTERKYAVHLWRYNESIPDINMEKCTYTRVSKVKNKLDTIHKFCEEVTLLHPVVDLNIPVSSIEILKDPLLEFKVSHRGFITIALYGSEMEHTGDYNIFDISMKKLHRFVFLIKDVEKNIKIGCKVEKYGLVFTVKQDNYEADYFCADYIKLN